MHVVFPKEASTCRSNGPKGEWIEKSKITSLRVAVSKGRSYRWRWWKNLNQDHIKQSLLWSKEKRR